jgi:hypothetical protein
MLNTTVAKWLLEYRINLHIYIYIYEIIFFKFNEQRIKFTTL